MQRMMKTIGTRLAILLAAACGAAASVGLVAPRGLAASGSESVRGCSNATLRGHFGLLAAGVRGLGPTVTERFVATALWTFDGEGAFRQRTGAALHGELTGINPDPGEIPGSYQVNPNCTGSLQLLPPDLPFPIVYSFVIVDGGREVKAAVMSPQPNIVTVELKRR